MKQWTGIPTCVGIGPTKTLAKLANWAAKHYSELNGVCNLSDPIFLADITRRTAVEEVWGIGPASQRKLYQMGVKTVADLMAMDRTASRKLMTVVGERTVYELRGLSCIALEEVPPQRKGCTVSRMFGERITAKDELCEAIAHYATRLGEKLRQHDMAANSITAFFHTSPHEPGYIHRHLTVNLPMATNNSVALIRAAKRVVERYWEPGKRYMKGGVLTFDLSPVGKEQHALFDVDPLEEKSAPLMEAMDRLNKKYGRFSVAPAAMGVQTRWKTKFEMKSQCYTTRQDELPVAQA